MNHSFHSGKQSLPYLIVFIMLCLGQSLLFGMGKEAISGKVGMMTCPTDISAASISELDGRYQFCEGDTAKYEVIWSPGTDPSVIASFSYLWYRDTNVNGVYDVGTDIIVGIDEGNDGILNDLIYTTAIQDGEQIGVYITMAGCPLARDVNSFNPIRKKTCEVISLGCVCLNNATDTTDGTFRDTIRITGFPNQTWNWQLIAAEGMLDNITATDIIPPVTILPAAPGDSVIYYVIQHRDDIGYAGIFTTGSTEFSVGNGCSYPNPKINLINIYCQDHPAIQMIVTEESGLGTPGIITVNGVQLPGDIYDPATRTAGEVDTVRFSWISLDGCIQPESVLVQIDATPLESIACFDQINVSLGIDGTAEITGDMMVPNRPCAAGYEVDIIGLPTNIVTCTEIGQIFMVRVENPGDGTACMGSILVEDKFGPVLTQLIDSLPCVYDPYTIPDSLLVSAEDNSCTPFVSLSGQRNFISTYCSGQDSLIVTWTATDNYGNQTVETFVYHWYKPTLAEIDFPANITQECGASIDTSITGIPTFNGLPLGYFCTYNVQYTDGSRIKNGCPGKYYIRRTWEVEDWCTWESRIEVQYLYFEDTQVPVITCPANITLASDANYCGVNYTMPNVTVASDCSGIKSKKFDILPFVSFANVGQVVLLPPGTHTVLVTVSDSCGNLSNCSYQITVQDQTSPTVVCQDVNISLNNLGEAILNPGMMLAEAYDNCALAAPGTTKIKKMGQTDLQFRDTIQLGCQDVGKFLTIIRVFDVYGNFTDCMDTICVIDSITPVVECPFEFEVTLGIDGTATILASDIPTVFGNGCAGTLSFSFTNPLATPQLVYDCDSLSPSPFDVYVYHNGILIGTCSQIDPIVNQNPLFPCPTLKINISGKVKNVNGIPLQQVTVQIVGSDNETKTTQSGQYTLYNVDASESLHIAASDNTNPREGVSTQDLIFINKHILGKELFNSPFQYLAADVDQNGVVSVTDILTIRKVILGMLPEFPLAPSWQFFKSNFNWDSNPLGGDKPVYQDFYQPENDLTNIDFVGVKTGDVSMNAANGAQFLNERGGKSFELKMDNIWIQPGTTGKIAVRANNCQDLEGFQGTLVFDPQILEINQLVIASKQLNSGNFGLNRLTEGIITFSYDRQAGALLENEVIFYLDYSGLQTGRTDELFALNNFPTQKESYFQDGNISDIDLRFERFTVNPGKSEHHWALYQNAPNPWNEETIIQLDIAQNTAGTLTIFDIQGKEIYTEMRPLLKGINQWKIKSSDLNGAGVYFYRLETPEFTASKKMFLSK